MCRSIQTLYNVDPAPTPAEVRAAALQFVRKLSGFREPSQANTGAFERAVDEVSAASMRLLHGLSTSAPPRDRAVMAARARERRAAREHAPAR